MSLGSAPSWHELIQPGPGGDLDKKAKRMARRAEHRPFKIEHPAAPRSGLARGELRQRYGAYGEGRDGRGAGRVVSHRTRNRARVDPAVRERMVQIRAGNRYLRDAQRVQNGQAQATSLRQRLFGSSIKEMVEKHTAIAHLDDRDRD